MRLTRSGFRGFAHPPGAMLAVLEDHGLRRTYERRGRIWQVAGGLRLTRKSHGGGAGGSDPAKPGSSGGGGDGARAVAWSLAGQAASGSTMTALPLRIMI